MSQFVAMGKPSFIDRMMRENSPFLAGQTSMKVVVQHDIGQYSEGHLRLNLSHNF
jgi:hypothetical protein